MEALANRLQEWVAEYGMSLLGAVLIAVIGYFLARLITDITRRILQRAEIERTIASFIGNILYALLLLLVLIAALGKLGVPTGPFLAVLGAAGLAVGFALQGSLANFAAGILLALFRPIKVNDFVEAAGVLGTVEDMDILHTKMKTPDNKSVIIPNSKITGDNIINYSARDMRRIDMVFGISYDSDIRKAREILMGLMTSDERILEDPEPVVVVLELADSSVNLGVRPWTTPEDYWNVMWDMLEKGKEKLEAAGIVIPFPQRDVHMYEETAA